MYPRACFTAGVLDVVRELELRDAASAAAIQAAAAVERSLEELRARAASTAELLARLPGERERAERARSEAAAERLGRLERVHEVEPPRPGLAGALDWTSRARAAVFVVRSGLEQERERIVREAEELGVALLGEQVYTVRALVDRLL